MKAPIYCPGGWRPHAPGDDVDECSMCAGLPEDNEGDRARRMERIGWNLRERHG